MPIILCLPVNSRIFHIQFYLFEYQDNQCTSSSTLTIQKKFLSDTENPGCRRVSKPIVMQPPASVWLFIKCPSNYQSKSCIRITRQGAHPLCLNTYATTQPRCARAFSTRNITCNPLIAQRACFAHRKNDVSCWVLYS